VKSLNPLAHWWTAPDGVVIWASDDHSYVNYISILDICNDGNGPRVPTDPHQQSRTAYNPTLNADKDFYIVFNPRLRAGLRPVVLGSWGRVTNLLTRQWHWGVWGESGPAAKTGEVSHVLGRKLHDKVSQRVGDKRKIYLYEMWPGVAATVGAKHYHLITAAGRIVK
jgi:hypothetical protein